MPPPWRVTCWLPATMLCNIYRPLGYQVPQVDYSFTPCCRALCFATQKSWIFTLFHGQLNLNGALPPESLRIQKSLYANGPGTMHGPLTFTALSYNKSAALSIACGRFSAYFSVPEIQTKRRGGSMSMYEILSLVLAAIGDLGVFCLHGEPGLF